MIPVSLDFSSPLLSLFLNTEMNSFLLKADGSVYTQTLTGTCKLVLYSHGPWAVCRIRQAKHKKLRGILHVKYYCKTKDRSKSQADLKRSFHFGETSTGLNYNFPDFQKDNNEFLLEDYYFLHASLLKSSQLLYTACLKAPSPSSSKMVKRTFTKWSERETPAHT